MTISLTRNRIAALPALVLLVALVWISCSNKEPGPEEKSVVNIDALPRHTLIYSGDFFSARRMNYVLFDSKMKKEILKDIAPLLRKADLAMFNLEGMIAGGGYYYRPLRCGWTFRAHPRLIDLLKDAGIDVLTLGNNHNPDFGPEALIEQTDRLVQAGIGYTGAGVNKADAARPVYRKTGDVVVAIVGAELTSARAYAAGKKKPGVHYIYEAMLDEKKDDQIIERLAKITKEARKHAHLVFFSPHWDAHEKVPGVNKRMRDFARKCIEKADFDAILAHGRHHIQGVEVFNGRPVVYDAGNAVLDYTGRGINGMGMLWQIEYSQAGVHKLEGIPTRLRRLKTELARGSSAKKTLARIEKLSQKYGTRVQIDKGRVHVNTDPGQILTPRVKPSAPERAPRPSIRHAPSDFLHEKLPEGATPLDIHYEGGIRLVGFEVLSKSMMPEKCVAVPVVLYWQTDRPLKDNYVIHLEGRGLVGGEFKEGKKRSKLHLPGDWILPAPHWPVGKIIQDMSYARMPLDMKEESSELALFAGLRKFEDKGKPTQDGVLLTPIKHSGVKLLEDQLVPLKRIPYTKGALHPRRAVEQWLKVRKVVLSDKQPWSAPPLYPKR